MQVKKTEDGRYRDEKGRFIPVATAEKLLQKQKELQALEIEAEKIISAENEPPEWLREVIVRIAESFGITPKEFTSRLQIKHPTPSDPIVTVDGKAVISWI